MFRRHRQEAPPSPPPPIPSSKPPNVSSPAVTPNAPHTPPGQVGPNLPPTEPITTVTSGMKKIEHEPIVKETIHPFETEEVERIIERDRDIPEIHTIIQPIRERVNVDRGIVMNELMVEKHEFRDVMS